MAKKYDGSDSNPMIVKDIKAVEKTSTGFKELAHRFTKEHKVTRAQEKLQAKLAETQLKEQKEETKKLINEQDRLNQIMGDMQKTTGDGQRTNEEHLKMVRAAFGNLSKEAKSTKAEIELQGDKFEPNNEKNMVKNTDMMVKFQEHQIAQTKEIDAANEQEESYQKTIDAEKRREAGTGQKLILASLNKMGGWMKGMFDSSMKVATTGIKGAFIALGIMALLEFLESETWQNLKNKMSEWMPKMQSFYDYLFKEETGLFPRIGKIFDYFKDDKTGEFDFLAGINKIWDNFSGIEMLIAGLGVFLILPGFLKLAAFKLAWGGVKLAFKGIMGLLRGVTSMIKGGTKKLAKTVPAKKGIDKVKKATTAVKDVGKKVAGKASSAVTAAKTAATTATSSAVTAAKGAGSKVATTAGAMAKAGGDKMSAMKSALGKLAHLKKYPGLLKAAKRIPLLGPILSGAMAAQLLLSDASHEEKVKGIGGLIGGGLGSAGFGIVGAAMGSVFPGPGTLIGGILGSVGGWWMGDWLGRKLAGFIMGDKEEASIEPPVIPKGPNAGPPPKGGMSPGHPANRKIKPTPAVVGGSKPDSTAATQMSANASANDALSRAQGDVAGGDTLAVAAPTTQTTTNNTTVMSDSAHPTDRRLMSLNHNWVPGSF